MRLTVLLTFGIILVLGLFSDLVCSQDEDLDIEKDLETGAAVSARHRGHRRHKKVEKPENFDIGQNITTATSSKKIHHKAEEEQATKIQSDERKPKRKRKGRIDSNLHKAKKEGKLEREKLAERQRDWNYCSDGSVPKEMKFHEPKPGERGHMCRDMYPASTCCYEHDLSIELVGDKIIEQVPELECARILMLLQCAHCSPRSWWLFHAPDKIRYPHKRALPIMCPGFCRRFQRACQDSVEGLRGDKFCDFHTSKEDGPCFPDSFAKRGTID